jgi:hypothetical protein
MSDPSLVASRVHQAFFATRWAVPRLAAEGAGPDHRVIMGSSAYSGLLLGLTLLSICVLSFSIRLFSVIKYESVIHEFDPYFNYRVTQFLTENGFYEMWNWFDTMTWYPLGRVVGGTVYPVCSPSPSLGPQSLQSAVARRLAGTRDKW